LEIKQRAFGSGTTLYSIKNDRDVTLEVCNHGARIVNLFVPVGEEIRNISMGFDTIEGYLAGETYWGATIGRVAGRISNGKFVIDGKEYHTPIDEVTGHALHAGNFDKKVFDTTTQLNDTEGSVLFTTSVPDGEDGFPGNLHVEVEYALNNDNEWSVTYRAQTDKPTLFNPTNHVYFNLHGKPSQTIEEHTLQISADYYAPLKADNTPIGTKESVADTPFDFHTPKVLKDALHAQHLQIDGVKGLDHPFFLEKSNPLLPSVCLISPNGDLKVEMSTTEPSVVIFTANFNEDGPIMRGEKFIHHGAITLETQVAPGAEQFDSFGSIELRADQPYYSKTIYKLIVGEK
jgi:aldose 1-epimerase